MDKIEYPIRVNRYLYLKDYCSRRAADKLIEAGKIQINGKVAVLGQKVQKNDSVAVAESVKQMPSNYKYHLFNKPMGVVSHNPQIVNGQMEKSVENVSGLGKKVFPVGRLDKESHGLMLLTNDGRIVDKMLNPKFGHERTYEVRVDKHITDSALNRMSKGVRLEDGNKYIYTKTARVERIGEKTFKLTLTEGKKHQIRRMASALGYSVRDLKRTSIMHMELTTLPDGKTKELTDKERTKLLESLGIKQ